MMMKQLTTSVCIFTTMILLVSAPTYSAENLCFVYGSAEKNKPSYLVEKKEEKEKFGSFVKTIRLRFKAKTEEECFLSLQVYCKEIEELNYKPKRLNAYYRPIGYTEPTHRYHLDQNCEISRMVQGSKKK